MCACHIHTVNALCNITTVFDPFVSGGDDDGFHDGFPDPSMMTIIDTSRLKVLMA